MITGLQPAELPHSEMSGSKVVCTYPNLIAAYHVLLRLLEPRHPPFALSFFFFSLTLTLARLREKIARIVLRVALRSPHCNSTSYIGGPGLPERRNV